MGHAERLQPLHEALENGACDPEAAERVFVLLGEWIPESPCSLLTAAKHDRSRRFYADVLGKINSEADDYRFGNTYRFDVGGQFRLYPTRYESFDQMTVNLVAELNTVYAERDTSQGSTVVDSGGLKVFATPGLQVIVSENMLFEGAATSPHLCRCQMRILVRQTDAPKPC